MMISTLDRYQAICILFCIVRAFAPTSANSKQDELRWSDLMAGKEQMKEINSLYTQHYLRAANGLLWAIGTEVYNEASDGTKRELKRCIASISVEEENPQKSEAKCVLEAFNMVDKEKAGVKWVGAFGVRRMKRRAKKQSSNMPNLIELEKTKSPLSAFANMATEVLKGDDIGKVSWKKTFARIKKLDYQLKNVRQIENDNRMFDSVLREKSDAFALARTERKEHVANRNMGPLQDLQDMNSFIDGLKPAERETLEFLSPKFAPLMPDNDKPNKSLLSPTFFSFFRDESPNNIASIPDVLNSTGLSSVDRDALMELIMEASGARVQVEQTLRGVSGLADWQDVAQAMIEANLRMNASWTKLLASLTKMQKVELDIKGYSFASHEQIDSMFFRDDSYYNGTWQNDIPLEDYKNYGDNDRRNLLRRMVGRMAGDSSTEFISAMRSWPKRMKQRVLSPFAFVGAVLTPSIFGYTILSPNIFSASVLSPVMLNLELLTPRAFVPVILGPRILSPRILGPRAFVPQILLANILSPAIVRPVLFSPFILTPLVLSPGILAPSALGGRVLSPALLNPAILSPGALNVEILSPSLLSRR
uniref:Uncharacterized protein n=1 Tax=Plectus sambesii TaxID=2011161 RepID=A0A914V0V6_9BILA